MSKNALVVIFSLVLCCLSCDPEDKVEITGEIDGFQPILSISEMGTIIEKATTISFSITDDSAVNTTIKINANEVFTSSSKQFSFELDPFDYPAGMTVATITAIDEEGNETIESIQFELKKLLYRIAAEYSSDSVDAYVAINLKESGELIAYKKINSYEDASFYADDDFVIQDLIVTHYNLSKNTEFHLAQSYGPITPGTERLTFDEILSYFSLERRNANKNNQFNITVQGTPSFSLYQLLGHDYSFGNSADPNMEIRYDSDFTSDVFLYHHTGDNTNLLTDYKYFYTDEFADENLNFNELTNLTEENISSINLPATVSKVSIALLGHINEEAFKNGYFRLLYSYASDTADTGFSLNYPEIIQYAVVEKTLNLDLTDGRKIRLERDDISNFQIPDLTIQQNDRTINIIGAYDFSSLELTLTNATGANDAIFRRVHQGTFNETIAIPFDNIIIPNEVIEFLTSKGFVISKVDSSGEMNLSLREYENNIDLPDKVFYYVIGNETGDATQVTFPLNN